MIAYDNIKIFCGNSNREFAQTVCNELWLPMGKSTVKTFADGEPPFLWKKPSVVLTYS